MNVSNVCRYDRSTSCQHCLIDRSPATVDLTLNWSKRYILVWYLRCSDGQNKDSFLLECDTVYSGRNNGSFGETFRYEPGRNVPTYLPGWWMFCLRSVGTSVPDCTVENPVSHSIFLSCVICAVWSFRALFKKAKLPACFLTLAGVKCTYRSFRYIAASVASHKRKVLFLCNPNWSR
jgi:hypothetical protein